MKTPLKLLVINDDPTQLRLACAILERAGYETLPAFSAREALRLLDGGSDAAGLVSDL